MYLHCTITEPSALGMLDPVMESLEILGIGTSEFYGGEKDEGDKRDGGDAALVHHLHSITPGASPIHPSSYIESHICIFFNILSLSNAMTLMIDFQRDGDDENHC